MSGRTSTFQHQLNLLPLTAYHQTFSQKMELSIKPSIINALKALYVICYTAKCHPPINYFIVAAKQQSLWLNNVSRIPPQGLSSAKP